MPIYKEIDALTRKQQLIWDNLCAHLTTFTVNVDTPLLDLSIAHHHRGNLNTNTIISGTYPITPKACHTKHAASLLACADVQLNHIPVLNTTENTWMWQRVPHGYIGAFQLEHEAGVFRYDLETSEYSYSTTGCSELFIADNFNLLMRRIVNPNLSVK